MSRAARSKPVRPYRFAINLPDLIADTQHLDPEGFGCYMRLLHAYWRTGPAKDDNRVLARLVGLSPKEWAAIRPDIEEFFIVDHGQWVHEEMDAELEAAYAAIALNKKRTEAATAARKARRKEFDDSRDDVRDVVRDDQRDVERGDALHVVPTTSKGKPPKTPSQDKGVFRAGDGAIAPEWSADLQAAESAFLARGVAAPVAEKGGRA